MMAEHLPAAGRSHMGRCVVGTGAGQKLGAEFGQARTAPRKLETAFGHLLNGLKC